MNKGLPGLEQHEGKQWQNFHFWVNLSLQCFHKNAYKLNFIKRYIYFLTFKYNEFLMFFFVYANNITSIWN